MNVVGGLTGLRVSMSISRYSYSYSLVGFKLRGELISSGVR